MYLVLYILGGEDDNSFITNFQSYFLKCLNVLLLIYIIEKSLEKTIGIEMKSNRRNHI